MFELFALITRGAYWKIHSRIIRKILQGYGMEIGRDFYIQGVPRVKIRGKGSNIRIGNHVSINGNIDIRNRENGKIIVGDYVGIDNDCRLVAANDATLTVGDRTGIGPNCVINCGEDVTIGTDCLISGMIYFQASNHGIRANEKIRKQKYTHAPITIGNDVWIGANATITKGVTLGNGCVVGAKSLVREGRFEPNTVLAGVPAVSIKKRS